MSKPYRDDVTRAQAIERRHARAARMALTPRQERFVREYLVDLCATQAAIRAGYSERTAAQQGRQLLQKPSVRDAIQAAQQAQEKRTQLDADWVVAELRRVYDEAISPGQNDRAPNLTAALKALELLGRRTGALERLVRLDLPEIACAEDTTAALGAIVGAVSRGEISPTEGQALSGLVEVTRRNIETLDLERRIAALEQQGGQDGKPQ